MGVLLKVSEIAALLGAQWEGEDRDIRGIAPLDTAGSDELSFVGNRKAAAQAMTSTAACLLVPEEFPPGRTLVRVADPRAAFARVVRHLNPVEQAAPGVHPTAVIASSAMVDITATIGAHAVIAESASVAARTRVGAGCVIGPRSRLGADCLLHANVSIYSDVSIGDRAVLHSGCVIGADGFGFVLSGDHYEKFPQIGRVEIADDVEIGANSCIDRAALGVTEIGEGTKLDNMVHVAHNCRIGKHVVIAAQTGLSGGVVIEDYAVIGGQVGIGDKARIETCAVVGSGAGILTSKIVRKGQVVWGTPARPLKQYLEQLANLARLPQLRRDIAEIRRHFGAS